MRKLASREQVMEDTLTNYREMQSYPCTIQREHLENLAELVKGDVHMLIRFSPANASGLIPEKYSLYEQRYTRLYNYKPWRPWT